jgi:hypothetical protein
VDNLSKAETVRFSLKISWFLPSGFDAFDQRAESIFQVRQKVKGIP